MSAEQWIGSLGLRPHPEGGWYREVYRAAESIPQASLPARFSGDRVFSTAIYFLLCHDEYSAFHRIKQDELWHFYDGEALTIHLIDPAGEYLVATLGRNRAAGESPLVVVQAGWLFAAAINHLRSYALVGCTVAPGFEFDDFEMPTRAALIAKYPQHRDIIQQLTRDLNDK